MKKRIPIPTLLLLVSILTLILSACGGAPDYAYATQEPEMYMAEEEPMEEAMEEESAPAAEADGTAQDTGFQSSNLPNLTTRLVIKNARIELVVDDPATRMDDVIFMTDAMGGYVVNSALIQHNEKDEVTVEKANISIRVPAERLTEALEWIEDLALHVESKEVTGQDVTKDYTDLKSRLRNLQDAEVQLRTFMENAKDSKQVMALYHELTDVTEEIELIKGQMKYYEESAAMSSISVVLRPEPKAEPEPVVVEKKWNPLKVVNESIKDLGKSMQKVIDGLIRFTLYTLPLLLLYLVPLGLVGLGGKKLYDRYNKSQAAVPAPPEE
ncbi:MAG: DUF4349 domain-containing protein [Anaerolineales bacterium]|nr:DUF4349 domain-containing protein [Anaerolineales bacterium]